MSEKYSISEADLLTSGPGIEALWMRNLAGHDAASVHVKLRLGYRENPVGAGIVLVLAADGSPQAQGVQGMQPRVFHLGTRSFRAVELADYVVNAEHRSLGPALMLLRRAAQIGAERFDLVYGFPNAKAVPVFVRAGFKQLGLLHRYAKLLRSHTQLARRMPAPLAQLCAVVVDGVIALVNGIRSRLRGKRLVCEAVDWDDRAIDELSISGGETMLLSERSGQCLRWRFGTLRRAAWQVCIARDARAVACGYIVWRDLNGNAHIGDFFATDPDSGTCSLMLAFAYFARRAGMQSISAHFFGPLRIIKQLSAAGLIERPDNSAIFTSTAGAIPHISTEAWYLTGFDSDSD